MAQPNQPRRVANFASAVVYSLVVIAILAGVNFLANRYNKSFDSTSNKRFTLSDQTIKVVKNLTKPVAISYWDQPSKFQAARDVLGRYQNLSTKLDIEYNDADKKRTQAQAAGVKTYGTIVVEANGKREEAKSLTEEEITGAVIRALKGGQRTVCFTLGSGEHALDDSTPSGFSQIKDLTEKNNYKTETLKLLEKPEIPMECTIVVVGGPHRDYIAPVVAALKNYVEGGGKALFMLDPPLKFGQGTDENEALTQVLEGWGVTAQKDLVLDLSGIGQVFGLGPEFPLVTSYESHPIVKEMKDVPSGFPIARSLEVKNGEKTTVEKLFASSADSIATVNLSSPEIKQSKDDLKGPLVLGAAGTYNNGKEDGGGRFVVVGNSGWVANSFLKFNGNRDLYLNMLNWLSSDQDLISIRPKDPEDRRINMNQRQVSMLFYQSVVLLPLFVIIVGSAVWWRRR